MGHLSNTEKTETQLDKCKYRKIQFDKNNSNWCSGSSDKRLSFPQFQLQGFL